ncbi:hypothetical protein LAZ67_14002910 [Cordylochernes scorpioides]|uniref:Retrotransposon gag domain-containing protein n=1 Tax=Cordylochernes scorpioides TaxID=51811 RepID=A0ABY6L768_9ARAC|nr:hypothetical protein LAZ67_14002910 [Cordylochernes scorpioides]
MKSRFLTRRDDEVPARRDDGVPQHGAKTESRVPARREDGFPSPNTATTTDPESQHGDDDGVPSPSTATKKKSLVPARREDGVPSPNTATTTEPGEESFEIFVQRFEAAFEANALEDGKRMPIFVSLLDSEMLKLGNDLFFPSTMKEQPYERLIQRIKLHLAPRKKVIPQRCRFLKRIQLENESVSEYLRELRHLAMDCTFGEMLEVMLRDRFVAGIKSESLQKKLLQEDDDVTLDRVFSIAVSFELAEQNAKELQDGLVAKMDIVPGGNRRNEARRGWQHGPGKKSADTELKTMIVQMSSEIRNLGERIDTRLSNIEKRIIEWDQRLLGVEMRLTTCVETSAATNEKVSENVTKLREIEARTDFLEMKLREPNLVFYGVEGEANEGPAENFWPDRGLPQILQSENRDMVIAYDS